MEYEIGIDLVENKRFINYPINNVKRILTNNEYNEYLKIDSKYQSLYLASRWSAKEAIYKAVNNVININLINIEILYGNNKKPYCTNIKNISLSVSHTENNTIAIALFKKPTNYH